MAFIETDDYAAQIRADILNDVTDGDSAALDKARDAAIAEMKSYLNQRYDVGNIFTQTGNNRNSILLLYAIDITLYHIHSRVNPHAIPDMRKNRYDAAIAWLKEVCLGNINPDGLARREDKDGNKEIGSRFGSNCKINQQW